MSCSQRSARNAWTLGARRNARSPHDRMPSGISLRLASRRRTAPKEVDGIALRSGHARGVHPVRQCPSRAKPPKLIVVVAFNRGEDGEIFPAFDPVDSRPRNG